MDSIADDSCDYVVTYIVSSDHNSDLSYYRICSICKALYIFVSDFSKKIKYVEINKENQLIIKGFIGVIIEKIINKIFDEIVMKGAKKCYNKLKIILKY